MICANSEDAAVRISLGVGYRSNTDKALATARSLKITLNPGNVWSSNAVCQTVFVPRDVTLQFAVLPAEHPKAAQRNHRKL